MSISAAASAALALAMGLRHGFDADHLAAIDGLTRFNMVKQRNFAPYCGTLFSAGHGAAILAAASMMAVLASAWAPPVWLEPMGKILSAAILLLLGVSNLRSAIARPRRSQHFHLAGMRTRLFAVVLRSSHPWQVTLVGASRTMTLTVAVVSLLLGTAIGPKPTGRAGGAVCLSAPKVSSPRRLKSCGRSYRRCN
jgi:high-affinity nickel-transport protein